MDPLHTHLLEKIRPWLLPAARVALAPLPSRSMPDSPRYGGAPARPEGALWPTCNACAQPLAFVAQFRAQGRHWRFFYCQSCAPWSEAQRQVGLCVLESSSEGEPLAEAQPPRPSAWVPHAWALAPVLSPPLLEDAPLLGSAWPEEYGRWLQEQAQTEDPDEEETARVFASWGAWAGVGTQIGGYPHPIQSFGSTVCDRCSKQMPLLARLDSEEDVGTMWADLGAVYLWACPDHPEQMLFELQAY